MQAVTQVTASNDIRVDIQGNHLHFSQAHGLADGMQVQYQTQGQQAIGGLVDKGFYYVRWVDADSVQLTRDGQGGVIDLTSAGVGEHALAPVVEFASANSIVVDTAADSLHFGAASPAYGGKSISGDDD